MQVNLLLLTSKLSLLKRHLFSKLSLCLNRLLALTSFLRLDGVTTGGVLAMQRQLLLLLHFLENVGVPLLVYMLIKVHSYSVFVLAAVQD